MSPSRNRRPGSSRREQYGTFFGYVAGIIGALAGAALLIVALFHPGAFAGLRGAATDVARPVAVAGGGVRQAGQTITQTIAGYILAGSRDAALMRDLRTTRVQLVEARGLNDENRRLKALLGIAAEDPRPVAVAKLTGSTAASTRRFAIIDAGRNRGVVVGMPVRAPTGLVGRVLEVSELTARVLLITDAESLVPVRRVGDGVAGFAQGRGDGRIQIRLLSLGTNPLHRGDTFVTSGSGGLYRPGVATASVVELTRDGAIAQVLCDPVSVDYVVVEPLWSPAAVAADAAPVPTPSQGVAR